MTFKEFFPPKEGMQAEQERVISRRYPPFRARAISEDGAARVRAGAYVTKNVRGVSVSEVDSEKNMLGLVCACVTFPDLKDAALQEAWGVTGAENLVQKMLLPGEYAELCAFISSICGYDEDINALVNCAKNS